MDETTRKRRTMLVGGLVCVVVAIVPWLINDTMPFWQAVATGATVGAAAGGLFVVAVKVYDRLKRKAA
jgi:hypothetical protein